MANRDTISPASLDQLQSGRICDRYAPGLRIEVLRSGKKRWKYRRRLPGTGGVVKMHLGLYPTFSIAEARAWAVKLNEQLETGLDPRLAMREEHARAVMTVEKAHGLYMGAVREGRSSRAKRPNKPLPRPPLHVNDSARAS